MLPVVVDRHSIAWMTMVTPVATVSLAIVVRQVRMAGEPVHHQGARHAHDCRRNCLTSALAEENCPYFALGSSIIARGIWPPPTTARSAHGSRAATSPTCNRRGRSSSAMGTEYSESHPHRHPQRIPAIHQPPQRIREDQRNRQERSCCSDPSCARLMPWSMSQTCSVPSDAGVDHVLALRLAGHAGDLARVARVRLERLVAGSVADVHRVPEPDTAVQAAR